MKQVLKKCIFLLSGILWMAGLFIMGGKEVHAEQVSLVTGAVVEYMGYSTNYFYVNGNLAFCLEPNSGTPGSGEYPADVLDKNQLLSKAMYYVYGGPGYEAYMKPSLTGGWEEDDRAYCLSHCILSYIYDGCNPNSDAFLGLNEDIKNAVINFTGAIQSWPGIPDTDISFSAPSVQAAYIPAIKKQRTQSVSCNGDARNSIQFSLPDGVTLVNETKGGAAGTGTVHVNGGDTFYFTADVSHGNGKVWDSGKLYGDIKESWRSLVVKTGGGNQDVGAGELVTIQSAPVSLQVKWMEQPELQVAKKADKESKLYKVGDVITYMVDITQRIKNAVAKNISITDTILTEGVKLQKNSIVLMEQNQSVISDAQISVKGNTYTISGGSSLEFLQDIETGERFLVEYQVVITDEAIIGKEIENEVVVKADNADEVNEKEIVTVEEPEKEKEPPAIEPPKEEPKQPEIIIKEKTIVHQSPKTGDTKNLIVLILLCILSCAVILTCGRIARKTK